jgi:hypothetical protein
MTRLWWTMLVAVVAVPLLVWGYDLILTIQWVGGIDLEVEFVISEAGTRHPIPSARVEVQSEGGFYEERDKQAFVLSADTDGVAREECRDSMCFGTRSGMRFTDTFAVHLPWWRFRVSSPGFESSEWVDLNVCEFRRRVHRTSPGKAKLSVAISLHRKPAEPETPADRTRD